MFRLLMASLFVFSVASPVQDPQYLTKGGHMFCRLRTDWDKGLVVLKLEIVKAKKSDGGS